MKKKDSLILIGMPGSGKSTVGVILAKATCRNFIDSDLLMQDLCQRPLQSIIDQKGIDAFMCAEQKAICSIKNKCAVIATGGSVVLSKSAMAHLAELGTIVYLDTPLEQIKKRISNLSTRGVVIKENQTLDDLYENRSALYRHYADVQIKTGNKKPADVAGIIMDALKLQLFDETT